MIKEIGNYPLKYTDCMLTLSPGLTGHMFAGIGIDSGQKVSKFFVSHVEESMAGCMNVNGIY
jgi:hypothetical protein